jgi:S-adenosylmethionine synthetase
MVDTYGGLALHGGGAFSGKDATKVDRSGAYMARMIAKNIVAAGLAKRCGVAISYAIGKAEPVAVDVHTFATGKVDDHKISEAVRSVFSLKPGDIIEELGLRSPIYNLTSCYGHFGNALFAWEQTSERYMEALKKELGIRN